MGLHRDGVVKRWPKMVAEANARRAYGYGVCGQESATRAIYQRRLRQDSDCVEKK